MSSYRARPYSESLDLLDDRSLYASHATRREAQVHAITADCICWSCRMHRIRCILPGLGQQWPQRSTKKTISFLIASLQITPSGRYVRLGRQTDRQADIQKDRSMQRSFTVVDRDTWKTINGRKRHIASIEDIFIPFCNLLYTGVYYISRITMCNPYKK